jgi:predicted Zn-dependent protease
MPGLQWEFNVIESDEANAFCLPGGKVAVYTGILPLAQTEAGLAAVIGHEVAHAVARHAGERMSQALLVNLGLSVADISLQNSQHRPLIMAALGLGANVGVLLPYSRKHEAEADEIGTRYMARAGYDPREAVLLWQRFAKAGGPRPPPFLSTHPAPESRAQELEGIAQRALKEYDSAPQRYGRGEAIPGR